MVDVVVALAGAVDAVGPVQAGVEPLRAVGRAHLRGQHVAVLVVEGARVVLGGEVAALPAPVGPGAGEAVEHLAGVVLAAVMRSASGSSASARSSGTERHSQDGTVSSSTRLQARRHAGLAEILLRQDVGRDLAPVLGDREILQAEDDRAIRIPDLAGGAAECDLVVGRLARFGEPPRDTHFFPPISMCGRACATVRAGVPFPR